MSIDTIGKIEKEVHILNKWLKELSMKLNMSEDSSLLALQATLNTLRDILTIEEVTDLGAQFPTIIKGIYYTGWRSSNNPEKMDELKFVSKIHSYFDNDPEINPKDLANKVLNFLNTKVSKGEIEDIKGILKKDVAKLFKEVE